MYTSLPGNNPPNVSAQRSSRLVYAVATGALVGCLVCVGFATNTHEDHGEELDLAVKKGQHFATLAVISPFLQAIAKLMISIPNIVVPYFEHEEVLRDAAFNKVIWMGIAIVGAILIMLKPIDVKVNMVGKTWTLGGLLMQTGSCVQIAVIAMYAFRVVRPKLKKVENAVDAPDVNAAEKQHYMLHFIKCVSQLGGLFVVISTGAVFKKVAFRQDILGRFGICIPFFMTAINPQKFIDGAGEKGFPVPAFTGSIAFVLNTVGAIMVLIGRVLPPYHFRMGNDTALGCPNTPGGMVTIIGALMVLIFLMTVTYVYHVKDYLTSTTKVSKDDALVQVADNIGIMGCVIFLIFLQIPSTVTDVCYSP